MEMSIGEIIGWAGGSAAVFSGLFTWIGQLIISNRTEKWRSNTETKLRIVEHKLSEETSILNSIIDVQKSTYSLGQEKRIDAITKSWMAINDFTFKIPKSIIYIQNALTESEIENYLQENSKNNRRIKDIEDMDQNAFVESYSVMQNNLSVERPFLGEELYFIINIYNAFLTRVVIFSLNGVAAGKLKHWQRDNPTINLLSQVFTPGQMQYLMNNVLMSLDYAIKEMEKLILEKYNDLLSGKIASQSTIQHIDDVREILSDTQKDVLKTAP